MPKITLVEPQKKNPRRFNIYLDNKFGFGADEDTVVEHRLVVGKDIPDSSLAKILTDTEVGKLMERFYGLLSIRMRSEKEVRDYLARLSFKRKTKDQEVISDWLVEAVIERLKTKNLINDLEFAKAWTTARQRSKAKGKVAIKAELMQKGIERSIIDQVVESEGLDQNDLAIEALHRKISRWQGLPPEEFSKKAIEFLLRRGFEYEVAKRVVSELSKQPVD